MSFFRIFQLWRLITRKRKQLSKFWDILGCSAWQDLSAVRIPCRSMKRCWSYCPFNAVFSNFSILAFNISESIIAREVIQIGIYSFWWAEHNGAIKFYFRAAIFGKAIASLCGWSFSYFEQGKISELWLYFTLNSLLKKVNKTRYDKHWHSLNILPLSDFKNFHYELV